MNYEPELPAVSRMDQVQLLPAGPRPDRFSNAAMLRGQLGRSANALRRRWWALLLPVVTIGGLAAFMAARKPVTYQSEAIMWLTGKLNLPLEGRYAEDFVSYIATQAQLMQSDIIKFRALAKVGSLLPSGSQPKENDAAAQFPFDLTIRTSTKNSVMELRATGPSPEATRAFLDAVMEEYLVLKKGAHQQASSGALSGLTAQIKAAEDQIRQQQQALTAFAVSNNISYLTEHGLSAGSHLAKLTEVLSDLRTEYRLLELLTPDQFKDLSRGAQNASSDAAVPGDKAARSLAMTSMGPDAAYYQALQQLQLLKAKRDGFAQVLRPSHSKMIKLDQDISGLEKLLKTLKDEGAQQAFAQMLNRKKALGLQIENLEAQYRTWEINASQASAKLGDYDRMKLDLQRSQALYDRLLGLLQTVDLNKELDQEPLVPLGPASIARPTLAKYKVAAAGLFLAFLSGFGLLFLLEVLDDRFTSIQEARLVLPAEVVGQVPASRLRSRNGAHPLLAAGKQPAFVEAFRNLRSSILFMSPDQSAHPRVFLVSSAVAKEGKTTVAVNLASTLAMSGSRVLLVDADLRRSSVHSVLGVRVKPGLLELLNKKASPEEAIVDTRTPNLFVLPAGDSEANTDFFLPPSARELLNDLAARYDYVIIDTAPVLATEEVVGLGPMTDGVYLVVRNSYSSLRVVREATNRLQLCNVKLLGVVYNGAHGSTDYYSRYSRDYHGTRRR
jgi:polysaccharide biosynthesis transport protein